MSFSIIVVLLCSACPPVTIDPQIPITPTQQYTALSGGAMSMTPLKDGDNDVDASRNDSCIPPLVHSLAVLYGSATGTAQEVAEYIAGKARRRGFNAWPMSLDSVPVSEIFESSLCVFVVSTTGDGEVPDNMSAFWRFLLRRGLPSDSLEGMRFAVFGLGDSGYAKYNAAARKLHARLLQLGAAELVSRGLGDDQSPHGMWGDLDPWLTSLWTSLLQLKPLPKGTVVDDTPRLEPPAFAVKSMGKYTTSTMRSPEQDGTPGGLEAEIRRGMKEFWTSIAPPRGRSNHPGGAPSAGRLLVNRRLTAEDHFQDVRHFEIDVSGVPGGGYYGAGDVAWVHPCNEQSAVEALAGMMHLQLDEIVRIAPVSSVHQGGSSAQECKENAVLGGNVNGADHFPGEEGGDDKVDGSVLSEQHPQHGEHGFAGKRGAPFFLPPVLSLQSLLTQVLDILGTPRRAFFEALSLFATAEEERHKLLELASPEGADLLYEYATREKRSYVEVLGDFPSCNVPVERLLELIPRLRPRGFSIASSRLETPSRLHLCVAVVAFRTPYKRARTGVCSSWLASLKPGAEIPLSIRPGTFKLPELPHHPLIMVGPGTGIAPMRSVILERRYQRRESLNSGLDVGMSVRPSGDGLEIDEGKPGRSGTECSTAPDMLFFGCRYQEKDFLYGHDWNAMVGDGDLALHVAFSRQNPDPRGGRVYVQRRIREQGKTLSRLIVDLGANVLVSGSAKQMPLDVREAFRDVLATSEKVNGEAGAERMLKMMEKKGRYCVEAWS